MATPHKPCNDDPSYDYYRCIELHFAKQRGCQYPWNVYSLSNVSVCTNYSELKALVESMDRTKGVRRETFTNSERISRTIIECPPPCQVSIYDLKFEKTGMEPWISGKSLQIAFSDFTIIFREEYLACDLTCVIAELGGNLGFFLGGSILLAVDILIEYTLKMIQLLYSRC